jgi:putative phosphoesterase
MGALRVGIISDTHGALPQGALAALRGADAILHAGDIGDPAVLRQLGAIAPVTAVRGNTDTEGPLRRLPAVARVEIGGSRFVLAHREHSLGAGADRDTGIGADVAVYGHTHIADLTRTGSVLWVNPGSASCPRGGGPPSVAIVEVEDGCVIAEIVPVRG